MLAICPDLALMNTLNALAQQPKRMFGEAKQSPGAGAESIQRHLAVAGVNQHDLGYFWMSQMKAPEQRHIVRFSPGAIDIDD
ncbi:MAG: hypothetical protein DMG85_07435 [Acidobacteria bacterium]|nr:MAG: hypothetical protein DMG85_07435 [Acidobacteriota bacterium]